MKTSIVVFALAALVAGCGSEEKATSSDSSVQDEAPTNREISLVGDLPDPCQLVNESLARDLLVTDTVVQRRGTDTPKTERTCFYLDTTDGSNRQVALSLQMMGGVLANSADMPEQQVKELMTSFLGGAELTAADRSLGNYVFVFNKDDNTMVRVLTGIRGSAVTSDRLVSEAHITMSLSDKNRSSAEREKLIRDQAEKTFNALLASAEK